MKLELTTGVALSVGMVVLFGFGFGAVEKMVHSSARAKAVETALADARGASLAAEIGWHAMVERYRGVVRSSVAGPVLKNAPWRDDAAAVSDSLAAMLERAGGSGFAAALVPGRVVATSGDKEPPVAIDSLAAVSDSFAGATSARLEVSDGKPVVAVASPVRSGEGAVQGVVVVVIPVHDIMLRQWTMMDAVTGGIVVLGPKGQVLAATLPQDTRADLQTADFSNFFFAGSGRNNVRQEFAPAVRPLADDRVQAGTLIGVGSVDREFLTDLTDKVRGMVMLLGAMAVLMVLLVSALTPSVRGAVATTVAVPVPAPQPALQPAPQPVAVPPPSPGLPQAPIVVPNVAVDPSETPHPLPGAPSAPVPATPVVGVPPAQVTPPQPVAAAPTASAPAAEPSVDEKYTKGKGMSPRPGNYETQDNLGTPAAPTSGAAKPFVAPGPRSQPPSAGAGAFDPIAAAASMSAAATMTSANPKPTAPAGPMASSSQNEGGAAAQPVPPLPPLGGAPEPVPPSAPMGGAAPEPLAPLPPLPPQSDPSAAAVAPPQPAAFGGPQTPAAPPLPPQPVAAPPPPPEPAASSMPPVPATAPPLPPEPVAAPPLPPQPAAAPPLPPQPVAAPPLPPEPVAAPPPPPLPAAPPLPPLPNAMGAPDSAIPAPAEPPAVPLPAASESAPVLTSNTPADAGNTIAPAVPAPEALAALQAAVVLPFDERHYRSVFDHFVGSKQQLGENIAALRYDGFATRLRNSEEQLIEQHGCRAVRFQVQVKDNRVSLRPQLVR